MPVRLAVWGLLGALSVTVSVAFWVLKVVGPNVTLIVQLTPAASELPQELLWMANGLLVGLMLTLVILKAALVGLERVTVRAALVVPTCWFPNKTEVGERVTATAIPVRLTLCGLPVALSVTVNAPLLGPVALGVKITLIVQLALTAKLEPQVLVCAKSPGLTPPIATLLMVTCTPLVLVSVIV